VDSVDSVAKINEYKDSLVKKVQHSLGANCTIVCGITLGEYAFIGTGAVINKDVKPYALMAGVPAKQTGWMNQYGEKLDLPLEGNAEIICPHTNQIYTLSSGKLSVSTK